MARRRLGVRRDVDDDRPAGDADLGSRQPDAGRRGSHCVDEILDQHRSTVVAHLRRPILEHAGRDRQDGSYRHWLEDVDVERMHAHLDVELTVQGIELGGRRLDIRE